MLYRQKAVNQDVTKQIKFVNYRNAIYQGSINELEQR
jgi:hypothetical protein